MLKFLKNFALMAVLFLGACNAIQEPAPVVYMGLDLPSTAGSVLIKQDDTLYSIAQRNRVPLRDLIDYNGLQPPYNLEVGDRLNLPNPLDYEVIKGDTIYGISRTFKVSMNELAQLNNLQEPYVLNIGQTLRLPSKYGRAVETNPTVIARKNAPVQQKLGRNNTPKKFSPPPSRSGKFNWPVSGQVVSNFGPQGQGKHNDGINIAAPKGTPVRSAENGVVVYTGDQIKGFGNMVLVKHDDGYISAYAHLDKVMIKRGQKLAQGETLGTVGKTGRVKTPQLHFEIRKGADAINPRKYLG